MYGEKVRITKIWQGILATNTILLSLLDIGELKLPSPCGEEGSVGFTM
jgi:hypothetical protein